MFSLVGISTSLYEIRLLSRFGSVIENNALSIILLLNGLMYYCGYTLQYYEGVRAMWLAEKGGEVYRHPYDLGAYDNLTLVRFLRYNQFSHRICFW